MTEKNKPVLSICIPTWNRAKFLDDSLTKISRQLIDIDKEDIEFIVSDNASDDDTPQIVKKHIEQDEPIIYNRNKENIGAARNFIKCMQLSTGKYIWLLGDDDFLRKGALKLLIDTLKKQEYGLLHLYVQGTKTNMPTVYNNKKDFLCKVGYWITFMSGNIFNRDIIKNVNNPEQYIPSHLLQVPFYLEAACSYEKNVMIDFNLILYPAADSKNNGGYNFFEVFVKYYLEIWKERLTKFDLMNIYEDIKKNIYTKFTMAKVVELLILRRNIHYDKNQKFGRKGYDISNAWKILFHYYGNNLYFYIATIKYPITIIFRKIKKLMYQKEQSSI